MQALVTSSHGSHVEGPGTGALLGNGRVAGPDQDRCPDGELAHRYQPREDVSREARDEQAEHERSMEAGHVRRQSTRRRFTSDRATQLEETDDDESQEEEA